MGENIDGSSGGANASRCWNARHPRHRNPVVSSPADSVAGDHIVVNLAPDASTGAGMHWAPASHGKDPPFGGRSAAARLHRGRDAGSAAHLEGHDGHVVRWRGGTYILQHTAGPDAVLCPLHYDGLVHTVPAMEVRVEGEFDAHAGRRVEWHTYRFLLATGGRTILVADLGGFERDLWAHLAEPCTVATRVWSRLPPQAAVYDQQRPRVIEKLQIYRVEVEVQFAVACDDGQDFLLHRWLLLQAPADACIAAAARQVCPRHGLVFEEGSVVKSAPGGM